MKSTATWCAICCRNAGRPDFFVLQKGLALYLEQFPSHAAIYGAFATVPIFLLWLYLSWAVVLVAATLPEFR